jgi:hypothetical protein
MRYPHGGDIKNPDVVDMRGATPPPIPSRSGDGDAIAWDGGPVMTTAAQSPGGVAAELRRVQARASDLQQHLKDQALAHGYPGATSPGWVPFVRMYADDWIPLVRRWQAYYQSYKDWSGHPYQWTHQPELDQLVREMGMIEDRADALASSAAVAAKVAPTKPGASGSARYATAPTPPTRTSPIAPTPTPAPTPEPDPDAPPPSRPSMDTGTIVAIAAGSAGLLLILATANRRGR